MRPWNVSDKILEQAFEFISLCIRQRGYPPTVREVSEYLGYTSPSSGSTIIAALEEKGWVERSGDWRRIIMITREEGT